MAGEGGRGGAVDGPNPPGLGFAAEFNARSAVEAMLGLSVRDGGSVPALGAGGGAGQAGPR